MSEQKYCKKYLVKFKRKSITGLDVTKVYSHKIDTYELPNYKINKDS